MEQGPIFNEEFVSSSDVNHDYNLTDPKLRWLKTLFVPEIGRTTQSTGFRGSFTRTHNEANHSYKFIQADFVLFFPSLNFQFCHKIEHAQSSKQNFRHTVPKRVPVFFSPRLSPRKSIENDNRDRIHRKMQLRQKKIDASSPVCSFQLRKQTQQYKDQQVLVRYGISKAHTHSWPSVYRQPSDSPRATITANDLKSLLHLSRGQRDRWNVKHALKNVE